MTANISIADETKPAQQQLYHLSISWDVLPTELLHMVLARSMRSTRHVTRMVNTHWRASHDAFVTELSLSPQTEDKVISWLLRRFPSLTDLSSTPAQR